MNVRTPAIGTLRDRVQVLQKLMTAEGEGGHTVSHFPLATVWARVRVLDGHRVGEADGRSVRISHSVVMRYRGDVSPGDRIIYQGRTLEVLSANDLNGRRAYLSCACSEIERVG